MSRFLVALTVNVFLLFASVAHAQSVTLAWDPNPEPDVSGYVLKFGTASRSYASAVSVGKVTQWTVEGLTIGQTYYFVVQAVNSAGLSSPLSAEVAATVRSLTSRSDLMWRNSKTGEIVRWVMNGKNIVSGDYIGPGKVADLGWQITGTGDFNRDGEADLIWQHTDGRVAAWLMRGLTLLDARSLTPAQVDPVWRIVGVADMDRDGQSDLLWRHTTAGYAAVWYMNGTTLRDGTMIEPGQVPLEWKIAGAGDFNGDGKPDLLWRNATTGSLAVWLMNSWKQIAGLSLSPDRVADLGWNVAAITDVNNDRGADIIWQHADGRLAVWIMNGTSLVDGASLNPAQVTDTNWRLVAGR